MNLVKIFKIKIIILVFGLSAISFGNNETNTYENLLSYAKQSNFVKFSALYSQISISADQKKEILKTVNDVIETERKYWRNYRPVGPEASIGKEVKLGIKICYCLTGIFGFIVPISLGLILRKYFKGKARFEKDYKDLSQGKINIPSYSTAAGEARWIDLHKSFWRSDFIAQGIMSCLFPMALTLGLIAVTKLNHKVLASYKRWKKACKIKKLIEPSAPFLQWIHINN